jgi:hypothetical protein
LRFDVTFIPRDEYNELLAELRAEQQDCLAVMQALWEVMPGRLGVSQTSKRAA